MLALHIAIALASLGFSTYLIFSPSKYKLKISYGLITGTLLSGTVLILANTTHLVSACISGLAYFSCVLALSFYAQHRLAAQKIQK